MPELNSVIPKGAWILVTGITGFIGCHITKQLLERGYKVRGTVRDAAKASWLLDDVFKTYADHGEIELAVVPDFTGSEVVFDKAIKGVSAIIHLATVVTLDPDPNNVIPQTVAATTSLLKAALNESSIKRVVYTTSYSAAAMPLEGKDIVVDRDTWNDIAVQLAWKQPYESANGLMVYMASKVAAEKEVWKFVKEHNPHFIVNAVSPSAVIGQPLTKQHAVSNGAWIRLVYDGQTPVLSMVPQTYFVDVKDIALLHVASALDPDLSNIRLQAWGHRGNWNDILAILRKLRPNREFISDLPPTPYGDLSTDPSQSLALLKKWGGQDGWKLLEETVADNISAFFEP